MVDRNIVNKLGLSEEKLDQQVNEMFSEQENEFLEEALQAKVDSRLPGAILKGTIVAQIGNDVIVEVGLKSEGIVDASEFDDPDQIVQGNEIAVLLEDTDSESGLVLLSKRKADIIRGWEAILTTKKEGDVVKGRVIRRIKGGLLVDIGVPVFLPASQVDIRKPGDISRFIGKEVDCTILKIDIENRNIVISRRKLIEEERRSSKEKILNEIEVGQLRKGVVKNIADFGVFVDLGGLDGLLHISDLSWGRISHPSEVVQLDQEIECIVVGVDKEHEKISLGLKQKTSSPWEDVEQRYPLGARVKGKVVNVMNYGAFVRLEDGIEGLVHISEMSWTRRLAHPSEVVNLEDEIEVIVLNINKEKQEISLGIKQTQTNPWAIAPQKYPAGTIVTAKVRSLTNFGAFVEIEPGVDGMIHISDLSWTRKHSHPGEALQKGQEVKCVVLEVNEEKRRVSLGIKQITEDPWIRAIPEKYVPGHIIKGKVAKLTNFGAFVELEPDLEGLLHISELADHKIDKPQDIVKVDDEVEIKILKVDTDARKIGLSLRRVQWAAEEQAAESDKRRAPVGPERVLSHADMNRLVKPQDKTDQSEEPDAELSDAGKKEAEAQAAEAGAGEISEADAEPGNADKKKTEAAESKAGDASETDAEPGNADKKKTEAAESKAGDASEADAEPDNADKKKTEAAESKAGDASETDAEPDNADKKKTEAVESKASDASESQASKNPILRIFKRKKNVRSDDKVETPEESEQAQPEQSQESTDVPAQAGDDSPEEKTEEA
ncbi:MAG: 30S ribosomal protein S1 [Planctomycetes bacterium]|nr:30S ribosomal protein S1 [Planctomycetota bacterium]